MSDPELWDDPETAAWWDFHDEFVPFGEHVQSCSVCGHPMHFPNTEQGQVDPLLVIATVLEHCLINPKDHRPLLDAFKETR